MASSGFGPDDYEKETESVSATSVIGLQWGDEAKGKIVDILAENHDIVVRYQGGNNAGHTVIYGGKTYKLSLLPAGILRSDVTSVIAPGVVINPKALLAELEQLEIDNADIVGRFWISDRAHVIFPYHIAEEAVLEKRRKEEAIGTTMRGIGTCYRDKAGRNHAIRMCDLFYPDDLNTKLNEIVDTKNTILAALSPDFEPLNADDIYAEYSQYARVLKPFVTNTTHLLHDALSQNKNILFEGAQGSLLDVDHGTYPFVTSSNSSGCGVHNGSGVPERAITRMIGVAKAYTTRVGGGPFPTELNNEIGQHIRDVGNEYGTVTGRPRRCGWFDAVATRYSAKLSGVDSLAVMLLDVLSQLDEVQICEAYEIDGEKTIEFPSHVNEISKAKPVLRTVPGWKEDISAAKKLTDLPSAARAYIDAIAEIIEAPIDIVSIGPDREQTIFCNT